MVTLSEAEIQQIMTETGASRDTILSEASKIPERINLWFPGRNILKTWSCLRSQLIIGPARKVFWKILCTVLSHPIVGS